MRKHQKGNKRKNRHIAQEENILKGKGHDKLINNDSISFEKYILKGKKMFDKHGEQSEILKRKGPHSW